MTVEILGPSTITADATRLQRAVALILSNAIKFTHSGGVGIRLLPTEGTTLKGLRIEVADSGTGIPSHHLPKLFVPFAQADDGDSRQHGGAGLGLCLCSHLIELMGGMITVMSRPEAGTTVYIDLPSSIVEQELPARAA